MENWGFQFFLEGTAYLIKGGPGRLTPKIPLLLCSCFFAIILNVGKCLSTIPQSQWKFKIIKGEAVQQDANDWYPVLSREQADM